MALIATPIQEFSPPCNLCKEVQILPQPAYREIALTKGKFAIVDNKDYEELNSHKWFAQYKKNNRAYYARRDERREGKRKAIYMHRVILGIIDSQVIGDHKDGVTLDNRRNNLRAATRSENNKNSRRGPNGASKYKGVCLDSRYGTFYAMITADGRRTRLGTFGDDEESAARAYDVAALELHGEFASLNFPNG